jgi:hypothetical protein
MKSDWTDSKRTGSKPAATPTVFLDRSGPCTAPNTPPRQQIPNQPMSAAPAWARYIDSRMKHFGTR